jgi:hypothetical protein
MPPQPYEPADRRRHLRFAYSVPVWLQPRDPEQPLLQHAPLPGRCIDISRGGLRVQTIAPILAATAHLRFETPDGFVITAPGNMAWERLTSPGVWEYGVQFEVDLLEQAIERLLPAAFSAGHPA